MEYQTFVPRKCVDVMQSMKNASFILSSIYVIHVSSMHNNVEIIKFRTVCLNRFHFPSHFDVWNSKIRRILHENCSNFFVPLHKINILASKNMKTFLLISKLILITTKRKCSSLSFNSTEDSINTKFSTCHGNKKLY